MQNISEELDQVFGRLVEDLSLFTVVSEHMLGLTTVKENSNFIYEAMHMHQRVKNGIIKIKSFELNNYYQAYLDSIENYYVSIAQKEYLKKMHDPKNQAVIKRFSDELYVKELIDIHKKMIEVREKYLMFRKLLKEEKVDSDYIGLLVHVLHEVVEIGLVSAEMKTFKKLPCYSSHFVGLAELVEVIFVNELPKYYTCIEVFWQRLRSREYDFESLLFLNPPNKERSASFPTMMYTEEAMRNCDFLDNAIMLATNELEDETGTWEHLLTCGHCAETYLSVKEAEISCANDDLAPDIHLELPDYIKALIDQSNTWS